MADRQTSVSRTSDSYNGSRRYNARNNQPFRTSWGGLLCTLYVCREEGTAAGKHMPDNKNVRLIEVWKIVIFHSLEHTHNHSHPLRKTKKITGGYFALNYS